MSMLTKVLVVAVSVAVTVSELALSCWACWDRRLLLLTAFLRRPSADRRGAGEGERRPMPFLKRASNEEVDLDFFKRKSRDALRRVEAAAAVFLLVAPGGLLPIPLHDFDLV